MKRSSVRLFLAGLLLALATAGCAARLYQTTAGHTPARGGEGAAGAPYPAAQPTAAPAAPMEQFAGAWQDSAVLLGEREAERKVIYTANLQLVVQETEKTVLAIRSLVGTQGGFVGASSIWREGNLLKAQLTLRVPADKLDAFLADVRKLSLRVEREESGGQDVTEEYVDLSARLTNLEAAETELRALLAEVREKSGRAEDVMAVYRELTGIRGQIEQLEGRIQYLDRAVGLATVSLTLSERGPEPIGTPGWQPLQTVRQALNALVQTLKLGVEAAAWVLFYAVPLLIVPAIVALAVWRALRRRRAARA